MKFFGWHRSKCNIFSLDWLKTYAIFLHQDRQLSWWFYIFQQDAQFWYSVIWQLSWRFHVFDQVTSSSHQDGQVSRWFYGLNKICNFYQVDILHFLGTLWKGTPPKKKWIVTIDAARFSRPEATKIWKSWKIDWHKNCVMAAIWRSLSFLFLLHFTSLSCACSHISHETRSEKGEH